MTAGSIPVAARPAPVAGRTPELAVLLAPAFLVGALAAVVGARWWATRAGIDPLAIGAVFGIALGALAIGRHGGWTLLVPRALIGRAPNARVVVSTGVGIAFGLGLVGLVLAGAALGGSMFVPGLGRPAAPFLPWAAITILVASGEEALLRSRLFDAIRRAAGVMPAIAVTTLAFALMHVPLYGWHVVPLDLAVGLAFAGLRLATRSIAAPVAAHAVADLATWWL
ncbi:MAG: CPBP family intramembrane glutamic endopeptidase [Candidatus Limnocylindrales bacterium]